MWRAWMSIANNPLPPRPPTTDRQAFAEEFVRSLMQRYAQYQEHKENMAYSGLTVFAGAVVAALVSDAWPPKWGLYTPTLAPAAALALFLVTFKYLKYQLRRRRWAALRMAGCDHVLALWIQHSPTSDELTPQAPAAPAADVKISGATHVVNWLWRLVGWLWPPQAEVRAVESGLVRIEDADKVIYPAALVKAWENAKTSAVAHERIIFGTAWVLGVALFIRSWLCPCKVPFLTYLTSGWG